MTLIILYNLTLRWKTANRLDFMNDFFKNFKYNSLEVCETSLYSKLQINWSKNKENMTFNISCPRNFFSHPRSVFVIISNFSKH